MNPLPRKCVVDASVGIKLVIAEELSEQAEALFAQLSADDPAHFAVPDLFFVECANVLVKYVRRLNYPAHEAHQDIAQLNALHLERYSTIELTIDAMKLALKFELSAYDACYLALAMRLDVPFITADERIVRKFANTTSKVLWLGNLDMNEPDAH